MTKFGTFPALCSSDVPPTRDIQWFITRGLLKFTEVSDLLLFRSVQAATMRPGCWHAARRGRVTLTDVQVLTVSGSAATCSTVH